MKQNYELPIVEIVLVDEKNVLCTSVEGMTPSPDPLGPDDGNSTAW